MATIGLIIREDLEVCSDLAEKLNNWIDENDHNLILDQSATKTVKKRKSYNHEKLCSKSDVIITFGGDGTLISIARYAALKNIKLIGVNFGTLGFLTEITPNELIPVLDSVLNDEALFANRTMIKAVVVNSKNKKLFSSRALNDIVIQKSSKQGLIDLDVFYNQEDVLRIRADGLIISSPTGSTAYSLAAGGPIAYPSLPVVIITPICPHSLTNRPFILPISGKTMIKIPKGQDKVTLSIDGQVYHSLKSEDIIKISRAKNTIKFVKSPSKTYFEILRQKLNWGIANNNNKD